MKGKLKLTAVQLVRLGEFKGGCFHYNGYNYLTTLNGDKGDHVVCINLGGPTVDHLTPEVYIRPIDLEIKEL